MCRYKCQCCGPCFCCKDNVETAFILGIAYIVLNALFFELLGLGITDGNPTLWIYFESCKIIHPIQHVVLIYGAHKRSATTILIWIILTAVILTAHVISGTSVNVFIVSAVDSGVCWGCQSTPGIWGFRKGAKPDFCLSEFSYYYEHPWI